MIPTIKKEKSKDKTELPPPTLDKKSSHKSEKEAQKPQDERKMR